MKRIAQTKKTCLQNQLPWALATGLCMSASPALALTIGNPQFDSYLAQPLRVTVPVSDLATGLKPTDYAISLLPAGAYSELGLTQPDFPLSQLKLQWANTDTGQARLLIRSRRAMTEPVLTLLLELRGPRKRWIKQLDLLLDPAPLNAMTSPASRGSEVNIPRQAAESAATQPRVATAPTPKQTSPAAQQYGPVKPGEVLSVIAQKVRPDPSIPLPQMAQAILDANPTAFPAGPRSLDAGTTLLIPDRQAIDQARNNQALMQPTHSASVSASKATTVGRDQPQAFLPKKRYSSGQFYPLSMEFLSYEAIRPIDLQPTLERLESAEPVRFKADWTLSQRTTNNLPGAAQRTTANQPASPLQTASPDTGATTQAQTNAVEPEQDVTNEASLATKPAVAAQTPTAAENETTPATNANSTVPAALRPITQSPSKPAQDTADTPISAATNEQPTMWWPWLLLLPLAGGAAWWRKKGRWQNVPDDDSAPNATADKAQQSAESRANIRQAVLLKRQLNPLLNSHNTDIARQAKVAAALLDRGNAEEAQNRINELAKLQAEQLPQDDVDNMVLQPQPVAIDGAPPAVSSEESSEFEQRRILKQVRKQLSSLVLSEEDKRQLKVAEALCERGRTVQAEQILQQLQDHAA